jgi:hypothetical protein
MSAAFLFSCAQSTEEIQIQKTSCHGQHLTSSLLKKGEGMTQKEKTVPVTLTKKSGEVHSTNVVSEKAYPQYRNDLEQRGMKETSKGKFTQK